MKVRNLVEVLANDGGLFVISTIFIISIFIFKIKVVEEIDKKIALIFLLKKKRKEKWRACKLGDDD